MERANAWENDLFLDSVTKVRNAELIYKAVGHYLTYHPMLFTRLMEVLEETADHSRVVSQLRRTGDWALQLGQSYLKAVQKYNLTAVNEALNEVRWYLLAGNQIYRNLTTNIFFGCCSALC